MSGGATSASQRLKSLAEMSRRGLGVAAHIRTEQGPLRTLVLADPHVLDDAVQARVAGRLACVTQLEHPCLVRVLEGGVDNGEGRPWLLEEGRSGQTLRQRLDEEGSLDPTDALQVCLDLLNGLEAIHRRGMLHGGLSPDQVLVSRSEGRLRGRLLEPGLVHLLGRARSTPFGPLRVDPDYAAPEVVRGEPLTPCADVYSVAIVLQEALTGRHPIPAPARNRLLHRLNESARRLEPGSFPDDEAREDIVRNALARADRKDPAHRFASARAFALALVGGAGEAADAAGEAVAVEGGRCAACDVEILPLARRSWGRHDSDRPFCCVRCERMFCGAEHWDRLGWTCQDCGERKLRPGGLARDEAVRIDDAVAALPPPTTPQGQGPTGTVESKESESDRRERTLERARRPSERLLALRELLTSSKEGRPSLDVQAGSGSGGEVGASRPARSARDGDDHDGEEELFLGAWAREKERRTSALARAEEARARVAPATDASVTEPAVPVADTETDRLPRPPTRRTRRPGSGGHARPSGAERRPSSSGRASDGRPLGRPATAPVLQRVRPVWQIVAGVLSVALVYMAWGWNGELQRFAEREHELEEKLTRLASSSTDAQLIGQRSDIELHQLREERDALRGELRSMEAARATLADQVAAGGRRADELDQALRGARTELSQLEASADALRVQLAERDAELKRAETDAARLRLELGRQGAALAESQRDGAGLRAELAARRPRHVSLTAGADVAPAEPVRVSWSEEARDALGEGQRGEALVALHVIVSGTPPRVRDSGGRALPASSDVELAGERQVLRHWLDASECARLVERELRIEAALDATAPTRLHAVELVVTPLPTDAARRLGELQRRSRW